MKRSSRTTSLVVAALLAGGCSGSSSGPPPPPDVTVVPSAAEVGRSGQVPFAALVTGAATPSIAWSVREGPSAGSISSVGLYTAPSSVGTFHVVALETGSGVSGEATVNVTDACWQLLAVDRVRYHPRTGQETAMVGGIITGSNDGSTTGHVTLATIATANAGWNEITFTNAVPYRWIQYVGPAGSYGQVAELEFYSGTTRVTGGGYGTGGSRSGNPYPNALDGNTSTFFDGPQANTVYVGLDLASGNVVATPTMSPAPGSYPSPQLVTLSTATAGATIRYTTDGGDPTNGAVYTGPFTVSSTSTVRAIATSSCMHHSDVATGLFTIGGAANAQSVLVIGNSLTDTVDGLLAPMAAAGGVTLTYARYTGPGWGTAIYSELPTGGIGLSNVQTYVQTRPLDSITMQPAENMPCLPYGGSATPGGNASDSTNIDDVWDDAQSASPNATIWVYATWTGPTMFNDGAGCIEGDGWMRDPSIWNPLPNPPTSFEMSMSRRLAYAEVVRDRLIQLHPARPSPYIIPGGDALARLKAAIQAGSFPGTTAGSWPSWPFSLEYVGDDHLNDRGRYLISLVFYAALFQRDPRALPDTAMGTAAVLTAAQAAALQQIAYDTVSSYPRSGWTR